MHHLRRQARLEVDEKRAEALEALRVTPGVERLQEGRAVRPLRRALRFHAEDLALDFRSGALPLPFSGHSISFARLPVLLFSGHLPVFPRENAFSNNFQKNAAFWKNPENIWLKFGQNSAKFWEISQNFVKISEIFSDF